MSKPKFYVYILVDPRTDVVFYTGKGCGSRIKAHETEARSKCSCYKCNKIRKIWSVGLEVVRQIVFTTNNEQEAYDYEAWLINEIGLGKLTNRKPGGGIGRAVLIEKDKEDDTEDDCIASIRSTSRRLSNEALFQQVQGWRASQLQYLRSEYRIARRFSSNPERAAKLAEKIEALRVRFVQEVKPSVLA